MNLKRTLSAALAFALLMTPAFVACSPDDNKKSTHQIILRTQSRNLIRSRNRSQKRCAILY